MTQSRANPLQTQNTSDRSGFRNGPFTLSDTELTLCKAALVAKLCVMLVFVWNTRFVMDEFWQFGQSKYVFDGFYDTIWPAKALGYALFYKPSHWLGWDASSMLLLGRMQTALLGFATLALLFGVLRSIGEEKSRAILIILILLCFSTFIERIFRTRSEPLSLFFAMAALWWAVRPAIQGGANILIAGLLSGCAFLATQKGVYFNLALGLALVIDGSVRTSIFFALRQGGILVLGWLIPIIIYCFVFGGSDPVSIAESILRGPVAVATSGQDPYSGLRHYVLQTLGRNAPLYLLCFLGMIFACVKSVDMPAGRRITLISSVVMTALIFTHNQPWPYVFIMALPFMVIWSLEVPVHFANRPVFKRAFVLLAVVVVVASFGRNVEYLQHDNRASLAVVEQAEALLEPHETYFDGIGMLPNRRESARRWLDARRVGITNKDGNASELMHAIQANPPHLFILTYRTAAIGGVLQPFLADHYISVAPNIMMPGSQLSETETTQVDILVDQDYDVYDAQGRPVKTTLSVNGIEQSFPLAMKPGSYSIDRNPDSGELYLLPANKSFSRLPKYMAAQPLFRGVYRF